jgi:predicted MFS family arabinose efflux permease
MTRKEKILLILLAALNFTHILDFMIMMPLGNYLMPAFNVGAGAFAGAVAGYNYAAFASGILASFFVDRYDRKTVLVLGYIGFLIGTLFCALAPTFWLLTLARIVAGLFGGIIGAQVLSIVGDTFPYEKRGRAMSWLMTAFSFASVIGIPLSLYLARFISWHAPFYFIVILGFIVLIAVIKYVPNISHHLDAGKPKFSIVNTISAIFTDRNQRAALLFSGLLMMGHFLIIPFINPFMEFNVGFSKTQTPMIYMVGGITTLFTAMMWGRLADKYGKLRIFIITGSLAIIPVLFITNMPHIPFALALVPFAFWFGVTNGRAIAAQSMVSQVVPSQTRGSFMSFNSSVQQLFTGVAGTIAGMVVVSNEQHQIGNYQYLGYMSAGVLLLCLWFAGRLGVK